MTHRVKSFSCVEAFFFSYTCCHTCPPWRMKHTNTPSRYSAEGKRKGGRKIQKKKVFDVGSSLSVSSSSATCHMLSLYPSPCSWLGSKSLHLTSLLSHPSSLFFLPPLPLTLSNCLFYPLVCPSPTEGWIQQLSVDCWESTWTG